MRAQNTLRSQVLSPPPPCFDEDDGVAEAMRRIQEGERDPSVWLTEEQFDAALRAARKPHVA